MKKAYSILIIILSLFLTIGCKELTSKDETNYRSLTDAVKKGDLKAVKKFIEKGADVNMPDEDGYLPIHYAASIGDIEILKLLIEKGADVNAKKKYFYPETPLCLASEKGKAEVVKLLVEKGADINIICRDNPPPWNFYETPVLIALLNENDEMLKLLLSKNPIIDEKNMERFIQVYEIEKKNPQMIADLRKKIQSTLSCSNLGKDSYFFSKVAKQAGIDSSDLPLLSKYEEGFVSCLCANDIECADEYIDIGYVTTENAKKISRVLNINYTIKSRTAKGLRYEEAYNNLGKLQIFCMACLSNLARHYAEDPTKDCGKLVADVLKGDKKALKILSDPDSEMHIKCTQ